ncbi:hypothetical protein Tco_1554675 [Tanacetum coccineum]
MEAHCIALELKYQNQALKSGQHGQILNETSNKAKIKKEIDVLETMNIELKHNVAKLLKENETLKKNYKDLYDSIKITRSKTIEQTTSLLANNTDLKAQIQEKLFAITALKNELRMIKGNSVDTKPVTQHYLPKGKEPAFAKPNHMIASSSSKNSSKKMPRFSSNDMVHKHYLEEAKIRIQERIRNSKSSVMHTASPQSTADDSKPKPRSTNHSSRSLLIFKGRRLSPNKTSDVYEKTSPRSDLRWKPMGRNFKTVGLRWVPTGKILTSYTSKDDSEPTHGLTIDIPNIHECKQTLDLSVGDISETSVEVDSKLIRKMTWKVYSVICSTNISNGVNQVVSMSFAVTTADAYDKRQQQPDSTSSTTISADGNFDL